MDRALVIGVSGGIGAALARALAERGADVVGLSRRGDGLDLRDPASVERVLGGIEGPFGWMLVATGILAPQGRGPEKALRDIDAAAMAETFAVNAIGPALVLRHAPRLLPRRERSVLGVLSARVGSIGDNQLGGWHSYRASKAALNQIVRNAAIELARTHPQAVVAALHPGTVETPFTAGYNPAHGKIGADESARRLLGVLDGLGPEESGTFRDHRGAVLPW
ncbi:SDR family NAD(P)-dependent oxidoreductase [Rubellimicrobium sp. CFH 75288]|uniref:SDR family NAD(P)-dependent oxidoreductase n=1 Tax=Rubellimicrobium sp. CFH 75288 TaxID=2697034 RepID=UPI001412B3A2|nr:SDR family NAD(P)-dependent oxidoreductase [Rubellimicrobium sp. CFH 75288]NAZ37892.1 SDR family NAD(P)-dependent oxidoreductase [Rubellimicrobium sp. CFH 75288]